MRLARYRRRDAPARSGVVLGDDVVALEELGHGGLDVTGALAGGPELWGRLAAAANRARERTPLAEVELLAPVPRPPKFLAVGMNDATHVEEFATDTPTDELRTAIEAIGHLRRAFPDPWLPQVFNKQTSCITGPHDPVWAPGDASSLDYEGELALIIGRRCRRADERAAAAAIAGYTVTNDVSVRAWQNDGPLIWPGKSFETHGPTGPWVVTADELDPGDLRLRTWVNGEVRQDGRTSTWISGPARIVSLLSQVTTLEPGDLIAMGTPGGLGVVDGRYLKAGDRVRVEVDGIGAIDNPVIPEPFVSAGAGPGFEAVDSAGPGGR